MIGLPLLVQAHSETGIQKLAGRAKSDAEERRILREYQGDNTGQRVQISVGPPVGKEIW
ncbi:MAG: hypothetical protein ABSE82_16360 [Nitrososphaerales archaeon]